MDIIQFAFGEGRIPMDCAWQPVVLIPKGNNEFHGIGLVEVILKAALGVVNFQIDTEVDFYDTLHGFRVGRGTGNAYLKYKLLQKLMAMMEEFLYEVFMDIRKAYDALYQERYMDILVGYVIRL